MEHQDSHEVTDAADLRPPEERRLGLSFTGSGSEYFRIWIVNILLILLTLGLYYPFAKARRLRYFYGNTLVDGQALSFHGRPWTMFRGFILLAVLAGVYGFSANVSPWAAMISFVALFAMWPALWRASLQFRLANTGWRGLRLRFQGSLGDAYRAYLPIYLPILVYSLGTALLGPKAQMDPKGEVPALFWVLTGLYGVAMLVLGPVSLARLKRYQHEGYVYAGQQTRFDVPLSRFYGLSFKSLLVAVLPMVGAVALFVAVSSTQEKNLLAGLFAITAVILAYVLMFSLGIPYFNARLQNLVWNGTRSEALRFDSQLRFKALAWLTCKNWFLTLVTLGLYRPFAAVNTTRLRLEAVTLYSQQDPTLWSAQVPLAEPSAAGDAAGDFFGIDMGL